MKDKSLRQPSGDTQQPSKEEEISSEEEEVLAVELKEDEEDEG